MLSEEGKEFLKTLTPHRLKIKLAPIEVTIWSKGAPVDEEDSTVREIILQAISEELNPHPDYNPDPDAMYYKVVEEVALLEEST